MAKGCSRDARGSEDTVFEETVFEETVTVLLRRLRGGDSAALGRLFDLVYDELRVIARRQVARLQPDRTLNATALVHELFVRLDAREPVAFADRCHLFAVAATAMRQIAVDYARTQRRIKRGGAGRPVPLEAVDGILESELLDADAVLAIDRALSDLEAVDERLVKVVELRFFGGFSVEEAAAALAVSKPTIKRDTRVAKAFLTRQLTGT